jgi:hypothetical protein
VALKLAVSVSSRSFGQAPGPTWLVYGGDQYEFTSTSQEEAEGFVYGIAVGMFIETVEAQERHRQKRP